jgi:D-alanyl-D-alanine carboxypeptidase
MGITDRHRADCRLPRYSEAEHLVVAETDIFDRPQRMTGETCQSWIAMKDAAAGDGIILQLVSAYRSINYQCEVIQGKLAAGRTIDEVLSVNAIPGYSEHHTGRALDLTTPGCKALELVFEDSNAFAWLTDNAHRYYFQLSYPRGNHKGITYEPWHWAFSLTQTSP